jgi:hypothetical protein
MFRLLSERITQIEAGWTKPLRVSGYGISKDFYLKLGLLRTTRTGAEADEMLCPDEKRRYRTAPQALFVNDYTGKDHCGQ